MAVSWAVTTLQLCARRPPPLYLSLSLNHRYVQQVQVSAKQTAVDRKTLQAMEAKEKAKKVGGVGG